MPRGVSGRTRPAGGRGHILPPFLLANGSSETTTESYRRVLFKGTKIFNGSRVRSRLGPGSKSSLFDLSVTETGLITIANSNFAKKLPRERGRYHISIGATLSKGQGQIKYGHRVKMMRECRFVGADGT